MNDTTSILNGDPQEIGRAVANVLQDAINKRDLADSLRERAVTKLEAEQDSNRILRADLQAANHLNNEKSELFEMATSTLSATFEQVMRETKEAHAEIVADLRSQISSLELRLTEAQEAGANLTTELARVKRTINDIGGDFTVKTSRQALGAVEDALDIGRVMRRIPPLAIETDGNPLCNRIAGRLRENHVAADKVTIEMVGPKMGTISFVNLVSVGTLPIFCDDVGCFIRGGVDEVQWQLHGDTDSYDVMHAAASRVDDEATEERDRVQVLIGAARK